MNGERPSSFVSAKLEVRARPTKGGQGLFSTAAVTQGELLAVWGGEVVSAAEWRELSDREQRHSLQVEADHYLAPTGPPEPADFVNHSCEPNAGLAGQISLVALRDIESGEEVCFDYAMTDSSAYDEFECGCGTASCRGRITGNDWMDPELQTRYAGRFSPYLQRRIAALREAEVT